MKRIAILTAVFLAASSALISMEPVFDGLSEAQRYDLAHAYSMVADKFDELDDAERAEGYRMMVDVIYPGFAEATRPAEESRPAAIRPPAAQEPDPAGGDASFYYFNKILRGVFNENTSLAVSVLADTLFLPLYDEGIDRQTAGAALEWFFAEYDVTGIAPDDVFNMHSIAVTPLDNGYWRLDVESWPEYADAVPEATFWSEKMGFYFRKFPEGWRLAAIGPVS